MQNSKETKIWNATLYLRLSRDDGDKEESNSITGQRELLRNFLQTRPELRKYAVRIDDGFTGSNFDRPSFKKMLEDVKAGRTNCIIVKDLSRFGRNYLDAGEYIEKILPFLGVRFIAVNDNYDSFGGKNASDELIIPFKNLINEAYCRDISVKVRTQLEVKRKSGQYIGYLKDEADKNHLIVDEYAADIVRDIFSWKLEGMSPQDALGDGAGISRHGHHCRPRRWRGAVQEQEGQFDFLSSDLPGRYGVLSRIVSQVTEILAAPELPRPETDTQTPANSTVTLRDVHFGYRDAEVLHGIDLTFREGTVNALVGPSGSGKSTIAKLIASFWDVDRGSICVGGADIRALCPGHSHKLVAYVSQENFLFSGTVRENIRMGRPDATDAEVEQAARDCGCYDFILGLENGFETEVGSGGGHLSGGERQRICIARAMLKNAPIVILDEATAYTDPENEALLQESIARLVRGKTLLVVAHRLSTIVDADQIVVVNDGRVEAAGTQAELLQACPLYQRLWRAHVASRDSAEGGGELA